MNDRLEKQEVWKEELREIIETLLKSDQWKYIMATSGTSFDFSENNPTMQEVNPFINIKQFPALIAKSIAKSKGIL